MTKTEEPEEPEEPSGPLFPVLTAMMMVVNARFAPATLWRWSTRGLAGIGAERIRLQTWYCGRRACTTTDAVRKFLAEVTRARQEKLRQQEAIQTGVDESELRDAGLL